MPGAHVSHKASVKRGWPWHLAALSEEKMGEGSKPPPFNSLETSQLTFGSHLGNLRLSKARLRRKLIVKYRLQGLLKNLVPLCIAGQH